VILVAAVPVLMLIGIAKSYYNEAQGRPEPLPEILTIGRIDTWINRVQSFMYADKAESSYQVQQSKIAITKGGWTGLGPGNSEARNFLPHPYSDFIYAIIIEEYGLLGGCTVLFIYLLFLFRCIRIMKKCPYAFGAFLSLALSFTLVIQALTNMAVNVSLLPVTGVTLPLISMGGSSFLFTCVSIGIILSVARNVESLEGDAANPKPTETVTA
jgi:cell division protein FtsW